MLANVVVHFSIRQCVLYTFAGDDLMRCMEISTSGVIDVMLHQARMRTVYCFVVIPGVLSTFNLFFITADDKL